MATNRQIKILTFFGAAFPETLSRADAHWEIEDLLSVPELRQAWDKYVYLTGDLDDETDQLLPYDRATLDAVVLPADWDGLTAVRTFRDTLASSLYADAGPFNKPEPGVVFDGKVFVFTGRFDFGTRAACEAAVRARGGQLSGETDYLVVGEKGNPQWKHGTYGLKIQEAILSRRARRTPAIITEAHWRKHL